MLRTIDVDVTKVPYFCMTKYDKNGRKYPLNGYVMNFYKNRSLSALTRDNWYEFFYFNILCRGMCACVINVHCAVTL